MPSPAEDPLLRPTSLALALLAVLALAAPGPALAESTYEGSILLGHPGTMAGVSASGDTLASCEPEHPASGVDAVWFELPDEPIASFELAMDDTLDADVYFYDDTCRWIVHLVGAQGFLGATERGNVPADAAYAVVEGPAGAGAFELTLDEEPIEPPAPSSFDRPPIQPGAPILGFVDRASQACTLNFVYEDAEGTLYIGAAGHCTGPEGVRVAHPVLGSFGTVVFHHVHNPGTPQLGTPTEGPQALDFSLIEIDEDKHAYVDPSVRGWGGPTGVAEEVEQGSLVHLYGHAGVAKATEPTRQRSGIYEYAIEEGAYEGWYVAAHPTYGGDSGGAILTGDGRALGTMNTVAATAGGTQAGPTIALVLDHLAETFGELSLVTADFQPLEDTEPDQPIEQAQDLAERCLEHPAAKYQDARSCYLHGGLPHATSDARNCAPRALWTEAPFHGCPLLG